MRSSRSAIASAFIAVVTSCLIASTQAQDTTENTTENTEPAMVADSNASKGTETEAPTVAEPERSGPVLDYEPTESISEDLSVAFPADI